MIGGTVQVVLAWWPGDNPNYVPLWWSVRTWGRIGKSMQYVGGLVALIDILGERRLTAAAERITATASHLRRSRIVRGGLRRLVYLIAAFALIVVLTPRMPLQGPPWVDFLLGMVPAGLVVLFGRTKAGADLFESVVERSVWLLSLVPRLLGRIAGSVVNLKVLGFLILTVGFFFDLAAS